MESSTLEQAKVVLSDLQRDLEDIRKKRRESLKTVEESHVQELEILLGIDKTKEFIEMLSSEEGLTELEEIE